MERFAAPPAEPDHDVFPIVDPCDGCGRGAVLIATFPSGTLVFCAACWRRHEKAIRGEAITIQG